MYFFIRIYVGSLELALAFSLEILLPMVIWIPSFAVLLPTDICTSMNIYNSFQENIAHLNPFHTLSRYFFRSFSFPE